MESVIKMIMKNKKADIAITILVIGVIVLCTVAFLSFYMVSKKRLGGINDFSYLQEFYNIADSIKYSGEELYENYEGITINNKEIKKQFFNGDLNITYNFKP